MKITFLGTSHGVPSAERFCSAALLETGGRAYLIDGGAPVADLLIRRGIPYEWIRAVFATHMHSDHTFGLPLLCSLANWKFRDSSFDVFLTEDAGIDAFRQLLLVGDGKLDETRIRLRKTSPGVFYADDLITVTAVPTRHIDNGARPSYAYLIDAEDKRVVFTGDMHYGDAADFPRQAMESPSDAIVCEMAHFGPETILPIVEKCPTKQILFNHVWFDYERSMAAIREAGKTRAVRAVGDGDVVEL